MRGWDRGRDVERDINAIIVGIKVESYSVEIVEGSKEASLTTREC